MTSEIEGICRMCGEVCNLVGKLSCSSKVWRCSRCGWIQLSPGTDLVLNGTLKKNN